ncbi:MAG: succinylglutamate desuccinylase/aspartoacylase family protein [Clostridiales bacterium]|nr:succinylglutamate desuccinylase/aspartoacylase family protein [Clostridiales bacterium]
MIRETLFTLGSLYRDDLRVTGYRFGSGERAACIVGALRGNEIQQMYVASQLVRALRGLEAQDQIVPGKEILVVPSVNHFSMNIGKRFWALDNTDINRMFPGYDQGETTQRIAAKLFERIRGYRYGMQFASFYMPGDFLPHVKMMDLGYQSPELGFDFGLPYVLLRTPRPYDSTTLNYNWQVFESQAFSVYTTATDEIDERSARESVDAVLRFLAARGMLRVNNWGPGEPSRIVTESELVAVQTPAAGIYRHFFAPGDRVREGQVLCEILNPLEGDTLARVASPVTGRVFFSHHAPLAKERGVAYKIIKE